MQADLLSVDDILNLPNPPADHRIPYGPEPLSFGELRLPTGTEGPHPVLVVIHGGCWRSRFTLDHIRSFADALTHSGFATWTVEYRRVGDPGGGFPGTFLDVARALDHVRELAPRFSLDLDRVVAVGHSAGGHLALWLAARSGLAAASPIRGADPLALRGAVSLAGVDDLRRALDEGVCDDMVAQLLGGSPAEVPERYEETSPIELLPNKIPVRLVNGARDPIVPAAFGRAFEARARELGGDASLSVVDEAGHFELIVPSTHAFATVLEAIRALAGP